MERKLSLQWIKLEEVESIGLDVSMEKIDVCLSNHWQKQYYRIQNNSQAISQFSKELQEWWLNSNVPLVIESTGMFHLEATLKLSEDGWNVKEINPIITNQQIRCTIRWTKTDKTDSAILAELWQTKENELPTFSRDISTMSLRKKMSVLNFIEKTIINMQKSRNNYVKTMGILKVDCTWLAEFDQAIEHLKNLKQEIEKSMVKETLDEEWKRKVEIFDSIYGISTLIAIICYAVFGNINFKNKKQMLAYIWLDPKLKQSWKSFSWYRLSKRWDSYIRKKLRQAAHCVTLKNCYFKSIFEREIQKWKHYTEAILTVAKKMVYIMFSLLKKNELYDENYVLNFGNTNM